MSFFYFVESSFVWCHVVLECRLVFLVFWLHWTWLHLEFWFWLVDFLFLVVCFWLFVCLEFYGLNVLVRRKFLLFNIILLDCLVQVQYYTCTGTQEVLVADTRLRFQLSFIKKINVFKLCKSNSNQVNHKSLCSDCYLVNTEQYAKFTTSPRSCVILQEVLFLNFGKIIFILFEMSPYLVPGNQLTTSHLLSNWKFT